MSIEFDKRKTAPVDKPWEEPADNLTSVPGTLKVKNAQPALYVPMGQKRPSDGETAPPYILPKPPAFRKKLVTSVSFDEDILTWLRNSGPGWQPRLNVLLREVMNNDLRKD